MFSSEQIGQELLPMIIDVEASGFGRGSYPIEVGFVMPDGTPYCSLISPAKSWSHWDSEAASLHRIPRELLVQKGKSCYETAQWLNRYLRGHVVYSDAWGNDVSWIGKLFDEAEVPQLFRLESLVTLLSEEQMKVWAEVHRDVSQRAAMQRHRASVDAKIIQLTYFYSKAYRPIQPDHEDRPSQPVKIKLASTARQR